MKKVFRQLGMSSPSTDQDSVDRLLNAITELNAALKAMDSTGLSYCVEVNHKFGRVERFYRGAKLKLDYVERTNTEKLF